MSATLKRTADGSVTCPGATLRSMTVPAIGDWRENRPPGTGARPDGLQLRPGRLRLRLRRLEVRLGLLNLALGRDPLRGQRTLPLERAGRELDLGGRLAVLAARPPDVQALQLDEDRTAADQLPGSGQHAHRTSRDRRAHFGVALLVDLQLAQHADGVPAGTLLRARGRDPEIAEHLGVDLHFAGRAFGALGGLSRSVPGLVVRAGLRFRRALFRIGRLAARGMRPGPR